MTSAVLDRAAYWLALPCLALPVASYMVAIALTPVGRPEAKFVEGSLFVAAVEALVTLGVATAMIVSGILIVASPFSRSSRSVPARYAGAYFALVILVTALPMTQLAFGQDVSPIAMLVVVALSVASVIQAGSVSTQPARSASDERR